jgi:hypothetical protein
MRYLIYLSILACGFSASAVDLGTMVGEYKLVRETYGICPEGATVSYHKTTGYIGYWMFRNINGATIVNDDSSMHTEVVSYTKNGALIKKFTIFVKATKQTSVQVTRVTANPAGNELRIVDQDTGVASTTVDCTFRRVP